MAPEEMANSTAKETAKTQQSTMSLTPNPLEPYTESGLGFKLLTKNGYPPLRGSENAIGYDLRSAHDGKVLRNNKSLFMTDIALEFPKYCYGRIAPRSGLALNHFISVGAGVIDPDFKGGIGILLFNHSDTDFEIKKGDRIAQVICEVALTPRLYEISDLQTTQRNIKGFGSTGLL